jgi:hypothetical protein
VVIVVGSAEALAEVDGAAASGGVEHDASTPTMMSAAATIPNRWRVTARADEGIGIGTVHLSGHPWHLAGRILLESQGG